MKEKDLKHRLQQRFDFSIWKEILPLFFKKIDYFSHPENLFTENDKVIEGKGNFYSSRYLFAYALNDN